MVTDSSKDDNRNTDSDERNSNQGRRKRSADSERKLNTSKRKRSRRADADYTSSDHSGRTESDFSEPNSNSEESDYDRKRRRHKKEKRSGESDRDRKRRERKRREMEREEEKRKKRKKLKKEKDRKKKEKLERGKRGAVTDTWGKYGVVRETDMWIKRPEFTAWLSEVKKVNLESLPNWEEKQMFKEYMEDFNTATLPSKKYYNLDAYYNRKMEKQQKKGIKKVLQTERTVFNDEEQRRKELLRERERQKEEEVKELKRSMQGGMAQAMKEQALLREEMAYMYKLGNFEAAAAIQRRLDPDVAL